MELLSGCLRVWEADELTSLLSSPGEEPAPHTALVTMFEAGDYRSLVTATQHVLSEAFALTEDFRQVLARISSWWCTLCMSRLKVLNLMDAIGTEHKLRIPVTDDCPALILLAVMSISCSG